MAALKKKLMKKRVKAYGSHEVEGKQRGYTKMLGDRETDGTTVRVGTGLTMSENYHSVRVDVSIEIPTTFADRYKAAEDGWYFVDKEISEKLSEARDVLERM